MTSKSHSFSSLSEGSGVVSPLEQDVDLTSSLNTVNQILKHSGITCTLCNRIFSSPKVLPCFHSFCTLCLETYVNLTEFLVCPICKVDIILPRGVNGLPPDYVMENLIRSLPICTKCNECKQELTVSDCRCMHCNKVLCHSCMMSHKFENCQGLSSSVPINERDILGETKCLLHPEKDLTLWCFQCEELVCNICVEIDHGDLMLHRCEPLENVSGHLIGSMHQTLAEWQVKLNELSDASHFNVQTLKSLMTQFSDTLARVNDTYTEFRNIISKHYSEQVEILEHSFHTMYANIEEMSDIARKTCASLTHACDFYSRLFKNASVTQCLLFKNQMDVKNKIFSTFNGHKITGGFRFVPNFKAMHAALPNTFGFVAPHIENCGLTLHPPVMMFNNYPQQVVSVTPYNGNNHFHPIMGNGFDRRTNINFCNSFDRNNSSFSLLDFGVPKITCPMKSFVKRVQMTYCWKFGAYGSLEGQFTEPNGVALNRDDDIIIADTNNNRVQLFNKFGKFKYQFGCVPNMEGNLLFPNRVAVTKGGDVIVTERAPTHQIQVYNQYGQFVRKFGSDVLHYPRALAVDSEDYIIIVECRIMRVCIFDQNGNLVHQFSCIPNLQFPNGVAVRNREIYISDNRSHCVMVYGYDGSYRRQIGCEGLTNYPIGVLVCKDGSILVADNHNNFNLTVFTPDGQLIAAYESKVRHSQCYDVAMSSPL